MRSIYDVEMTVPRSNPTAHDSPDTILDRAAAILLEEGATEVYVFGSFARGSAGPESDLDLAVQGLPAARVLPAMGRLLVELGRMSDLLLIEQEPGLTRYLRSTGELRRVA